MDLAGYVVQAVLVEGRSVREVAAAHGISKSSLYELLARYREHGDAGLAPPAPTAHGAYGVLTRLVNKCRPPEEVRVATSAASSSLHVPGTTPPSRRDGDRAIGESLD
jgi:transposase-like protein